jgi:hypothetical protein
MSFLSKIFDYVPSEERKGISLAKKPCWEISGVKDLPSFLRALHLLVPMDSVLYLEGGDTPKELRSHLEKRAAQNICKVEMGTIWPRPDCFHMQINNENLEGLAKMTDNYAEPQVAAHLHVYKNGKMLLQWYDAFSDPLFVSKEIPEVSIRKFCDKLKAKFREFDDW